MNNKQRIDASNAALESAKDMLPPALYQEIYDYINKHNEWGPGIEILTDYLCEEEQILTPGQFRNIEEAMESMGVGKSERIKELQNYVDNT